MDLEKYLFLLVVLFLKDGETGGHGEKHHDHVRLYVPEFIHHDHHTKVITIHHHHHKPKKEHHHHHHHHPKPHIPHHHFQHHHKKAHVTTTTVSKGQHGHHGHHGHHGSHGHHGHHGSHGHHGHKSHHEHEHHGHGHGHYHHDTPAVSYDPPTPSFEEDFGSFTPSVPSYGGGIAHQIPQVHGITHTVKQVQVYDSLPGAIPGVGGGHAGGNGYEVTEHQADEGDDDVFTSVNSLQQSYPGTYGYLRGAAEQSNDPFAEHTPQSAVQINNHDPFAGSIAQPTASLESFTGNANSNPFAASAPSQSSGLPSVQPSAEFPVSYHGESGFDDSANSFIGGDGGNSFLANDEGADSDAPVTFHREAGVQQITKTGGVESVVY